MRFENPAKFLEFYQKQLSRGIVGLRHPHPIAPGSAFTVIISPPGAPNQLRLAGVAHRVSLRPDGAYRLRIAVERSAEDDAWLDGYVGGLRAAFETAQTQADDPARQRVQQHTDPPEDSISGSVITDGGGSWSSNPGRATVPRKPALPSHVEISDLSGRLDRIDYYILLGVPRDVTGDALQARFHLITRRFHPDLFLTRERPLQKAVGRIYRRMNEAYAVLRSPERRRIYDAGLTGPSSDRQIRLSGDAQNEARRREANPGALTSTAEFYWDRARILLKASQGADGGSTPPAIREAIRLLHTALLFEPTNGHFQAALNHLESQVPRR